MMMVMVQILSVVQIIVGIVFLSYIQQKHVRFDDWRRLLLIFYSFLLLLASISIPAWIGKQSMLLLALSPTLVFLVLSLPSIMALLILATFWIKDRSSNLKIDSDTKIAMIVLEYFLLLLLTGLVAMTIAVPIYLDNLLRAVREMTSTVFRKPENPRQKQALPLPEKTASSSESRPKQNRTAILRPPSRRRPS